MQSLKSLPSNPYSLCQRYHRLRFIHIFITVSVMCAKVGFVSPVLYLMLSPFTILLRIHVMSVRVMVSFLDPMPSRTASLWLCNVM